MRTIERVLKAAGILFLISLCAAPPAGAAEFDRKLEFSIPAQSLTSALLKFAEQSKIQVLTSSQDLSGYRTQGVKGKHSVRTALATILSGTDLTFREVGEGTVTVARPNASPAPASSSTSVQPETLSMRVAQAEPQETATTASETSRPVRTEEETAAQSSGVPEMLVKDSRISNTDIRRTEDDPQPYVVFDSEQIERSMASSLEDFLKTRLPMNAIQQTNSQYVGLRFGNQSQINLRGLGTNQTLVLVNGRRQPSIIDGFSFNEFNQPDINGIPLATIERIEVLPSTASGIYGGGATGGVVNIVLKRNYTGGEFSAGYNNTFATHAGERRLDGSIGFTLEGGKTSVMLAGSYSDSSPLRVGDRNFSARGRALLMENDPGAIYSDIFNTPRGATPNFKSLDGNDLVLLDGTPLNSNVTHSPYGYAGVSSDGGLGLLANAGTLNFDLPPDASGLQQSLINDPEVRTGSVSLRREFGANFEAFMDWAVRRNIGEASMTLVDGSAYLASGDPLNPFDNFVEILFPIPDLESRFRTFSETRQGTAGLTWRLPGQWAINAEYSWSRARFEYGYRGLNAAGAQAITDGTIDFTRDPVAYPQDYSQYIAPERNFLIGPQDTILKSPSLWLVGPVAKLPGGALTVTAQVQQREEEALNSFATFSDGEGTAFGYAYNPHRSQDIRSAYAEMRAPLVSKVNARPFLHDLQLQFSARHDRYRTETAEPGNYFVDDRDGPLPDIPRAVNQVNSTDYTFGIRYAPMRDLALRASYGTGFLPPSLSQIFPSVYPSTFIFGNDPKRGGEFFAYNAAVLDGGSESLQPEESRSWSAGAIYTPEALPGLRVTLDYTRIRKSAEISGLSVQDILDNEEALSDRITRGPLSAQDVIDGFTGGRITAVDTSLSNLTHTEVEAFDLQFDYQHDLSELGRLSFFVLTTYQPLFERQIVPASPVVDTVGFSDGALKWRGNGGITWAREGWTLGWNTQYYNHYKTYPANSSPFFTEARIRWQGSETIPHQLYHDIYGRYRFTGGQRGFTGFLSGVELTASIQNVFDTSPPIIASSDPNGGYSYYGDPRLRRYALSLRKSF